MAETDVHRHMGHHAGGADAGEVRGRGGRRAAARCGGQILIVVVVSILALVGLAFYVFNAGALVNRRTALQHAADSTAISGATWMARSMNIVAMNNVAQARLIALVAVLDALPLAAEMTIAEETNENRLALALQRWRTVAPAFTVYEEDNFYRRGLADLYHQMSSAQGSEDPTHLDLLEDVDQTLDHRDEREPEGVFDVARATEWSYNGGSPGGSIWRAMRALDEFSQAVEESAGVLAQADAVEFGKRNDANMAFLTPILPRLPVVRTHWRDFGPVLLDHIRYGWENGNLPNRRWVHEVIPSELVEKLSASKDVAWDCRIVTVRGGAIPDFAYPHRMGPFARLFRWRDHWPYTYNWETSSWELQAPHGYTTLGPLEHALRIVVGRFGQAGSHMGSVDTSRFAFHLRTLAKVKLAYMFGLPSPQRVQYADEWITDYELAKQYVTEHQNDDPTPVMVTRYYRVHVKSTTPYSDRTHWMRTHDPRPPTQTFTPRRYWSHQLRTPAADVYDPKRITFWIEDGRGWRDVGGNFEKLTDHVWIRKWGPVQVNQDHDLGLPERFELDANGAVLLDDNGKPIPIPYKIWHVHWRCFGGIEIRDEIELSNPIAGASFDQLPRPHLIDPTGERGEWLTVRQADGSPLQGLRVEPFAYLGAARIADGAPVWRQQFSGANPLGGMVALAQAKMFNSFSWDAWTQDWQVQLAPVQDWQGWVDDMHEGLPDAAETQGRVDEAALEAIWEYLSRLGPELAERFLQH